MAPDVVASLLKLPAADRVEFGHGAFGLFFEIVADQVVVPPLFTLNGR